MRKTVVAAMSMAVFLGAATPSFAQTAEPARASTGAAFGLSGSGLLPISPTPTAVATQPPDTDRQILGQNFNSVLPLNLGGEDSSLAVTGTINAVAQAASEPRIETALDGNPDGVSARGFARVDGLSLLGDVNLLEALGLDLAEATDLLSAEVIQSEATATCVDGRPVFSTDSQIVGDLDPLDLNLGPALNDILGALLDTLNIQGVLDIVRDESGVLPDGSGVFVNALRINVLGLEELVIGHAEARMPADCRVPPAAPPTTAAPAPRGGALAATGTELPFLPLGLGIVALGVILNWAVRRTTRRTTA
jgi:hypothetical protein